MLRSMMCGFWDWISDFFTGLFALIPQYMYFIYACIASLLDAMQFVVRKLAGLDAYFINGEKTSGDIVYSFISGILGINGGAKYSALSTVFWSMIIFGGMLLVITTIFAIIRAHYKGSADDADPRKVIASSIKTLFLMAIIPVASIFGILLSNVLLQGLDSITSPASSTQLSAVYEHSSVEFSSFFKSKTTSTGGKAYASYDFFGLGAYTDSVSFSGVMFRIGARNANRVRNGSYTPKQSTTDDKWSDFGIFTSEVDDEDTRREEVAMMIDVAFANNLTMQERRTPSLFRSESSALISSFMYLQSAAWYAGIIQFKTFSKFNVGLVWYYYNLWRFDYFIAFAAMSVALTFFSSVMFGLIVRMIECIALFLVFPPLVGMGPLDGNKAIENWKKHFIGDVLMAYGAVVGLNLSLMVMNEVSKIRFFTKDLLNNLMDVLLILVVLSTIKDLVKLVGSFVGGADANATGEATKAEVKKVATKAAKTTLKAAKLGVKIGSIAMPALKGVAQAVDKIEKKIQEIKNWIAQKQQKEGLKKLQDQVAAKQKEVEEKQKEKGDEEEQSEEESKEFEEELENEDIDDIGTDESKERMKRFADQHRQSNSNFDMDKLYEDYYSTKYKEGAEEIDADTTLNDEQKRAKKQELAKKLRKDTVALFRGNNDHAVNAKNKEKELDDKRKEVDEAEQNLDGFLEGKKVFNEKGELIDQPEGQKSHLKSGILDLAGQALQLAGDVTGVISGFEKLDEEGVVDAGKEVVQEIVAQTVGKDGITYQRMLKGKSKLSTKDQKDDADKEKHAAYVQSLKRQAEVSERMKREVLNLVNVISQKPSRIKPTVKAEIKTRIENNKAISKYSNKMKGLLLGSLRELGVDVPLGGFKPTDKGNESQKKDMVDEFYKSKIVPALAAEMRTYTGSSEREEAAFAENAMRKVLSDLGSDISNLKNEINSI